MSFKAKTVLNKDIRVFKKDINNIGDAFEALRNFIKEKYELQGQFSIQYEDEEKDVITIASSEDLEEAYNQAETNGTVLKLLIVPDDIGVPVYSITTELDKSENNNDNDNNNNNNNNNNNDNDNDNNKNNNNDAEKKESDSSSSCSSSDDEIENENEKSKCIGEKLLNDLVNNKEFREEFINFVTTFIVKLQDDILKVTSDSFTQSLNAHENVSQHPAMKKLAELFPTLIAQFQPFLSFINTIDVENIEGLINSIIDMFGNNNNNDGCHFKGPPPSPLFHMLMQFLGPLGGRRRFGSHPPPPPPPPFNPLARLFDIFTGRNDNTSFGPHGHPHPHPHSRRFGHHGPHGHHHGPHHKPHHGHPPPPPPHESNEYESNEHESNESYRPHGPHHGFGHHGPHHGPDFGRHHYHGHHGHHGRHGHHGPRHGHHGWFDNNNNNSNDDCKNFNKEEKCLWKRKHFGKCHGKWGKRDEEENNDYNVEIIKDNLTLSDKGYVLPGQVVVKTWLIKNNGKKDWPQGILLKYDGRTFNPIVSGATFSVPSLKIGEEAEVSVTIETPKEESNFGKQKAFFKLSLPDGTLFGPFFKIRLFIVSENNNNNNNDSEEEKSCKQEKKKGKLLKEKAKLEEKVAKLDAKLAKQEFSKIQSDNNNNNNDNNNNNNDNDIKDSNLEGKKQISPPLDEPAPVLPLDNDIIDNEHEKDASSSFSFSEVDGHDAEVENNKDKDNNNDEPVMISNIKSESAKGKEPFKYEEQLNTLIGMGINDVDQVCRLLNENNGNVDAVINLLFN